MKITIDIPEKIVEAAKAILMATIDDEDLIVAMNKAAKELDENGYETDLSELDNARQILLALAVSAIGIKASDMADDSPKVGCDDSFGSLAERLKQMQEERERLMKERAERKDENDG